MRIRKAAAVALAASILLSACASNGMYGSGGYDTQQLRFGVIQSITPVEIRDSGHYGIGSVIGTVAGGLLGSQIGGGTGRDVGALLGALGGGYLGSEVQQREAPAQPQMAQYVMVRMQNGVGVGVTQPPNPQLFVGENVVVEGSGPDARVVPQ
ncbi:glycine zipper 2TM domain-containing protein [Crenobacter caeni]|uniref:Glycine zipper 2TM domain-containing protein n=1 Tax=Crenobacter caeni TaxID=2705474 RepID=A0A6B2KVS3_9NEIS|nr:glycine zipper 2TM domain-containing protein [Crenobacter caeni]NDV14342.1 glycine zipper 2TM domain-containing protein [Crenobacter caeni]